MNRPLNPSSAVSRKSRKETKDGKALGKNVVGRFPANRSRATTPVLATSFAFFGNSIPSFGLKMFLPTLGVSLLAASVDAAEGHQDNRYWFEFGPQFGLNMTTSFKHLGNSALGPATGSGFNRTYDDGFVHVDSSGNRSLLTWNWGYQNAPQVSGSTLTLHGKTANAKNFPGENDDVHAGMDLSVGRRFGDLPGGTWGWMGALDFTSVHVRDQHPLSGTAALISDAYQLGVVIAPPAPYSGTFNGPGPLLESPPTRTITPDTVVITGRRTLDAQVFALRTGPYYEFKLGEKWSGRVSGGLALGLADMEYSYNQTLTYGSGPVLNQARSGSDLVLRAGPFVEGKVIYAVNDQLGLYARAQFAHLGEFSNTTGQERASLDMRGAVHVGFGLQWRF